MGSSQGKKRALDSVGAFLMQWAMMKDKEKQKLENKVAYEEAKREQAKLALEKRKQDMEIFKTKLGLQADKEKEAAKYRDNLADENTKESRAYQEGQNRKQEVSDIIKTTAKYSAEREQLLTKQKLKKEYDIWERDMSNPNGRIKPGDSHDVKGMPNVKVVWTGKNFQIVQTKGAPTEKPLTDQRASLDKTLEGLHKSLINLQTKKGFSEFELFFAKDNPKLQDAIKNQDISAAEKEISSQIKYNTEKREVLPYKAQFRTTEDVRNAYEKGALKREVAAKILHYNFGLQMGTGE